MRLWNVYSAQTRLLLAGFAFICSVSHLGCAPELLRGNQAVIATSGGTAACPATLTPTVDNVYATNSDWNDYVRFDNDNGGTTAYNQDDEACDGTDTGSYWNCIHGGEKRKITLTGITSCTDVVAVDDLAAFDWICDATSGTAVIYMRSLKPSKGLRDLVTATGFIDNRVTVTRTTCTLARTALGSWWGNTFSVPAANALATDNSIQLTNTGTNTIHVIDADRTTTGYSLDADHIALVTLAGVDLTYSGKATGNCNNGAWAAAAGSRVGICMAGQRYNWIEVNFDGNAAAGSDLQTGAWIMTSLFYRMQGTTFRNISSYIFRGEARSSMIADYVTYQGDRNLISDGRNSVLLRWKCSNIQNTCLEFSGGTVLRPTIQDIFSAQSQYYTVWLQAGAADSIQEATMTKIGGLNALPVAIQNTTGTNARNTVGHVTALNQTATSIDATDTVQFNIVGQGGQNGVVVTDGAGDSYFYDLHLSHHAASGGVRVTGTAGNVRIRGALRMSNANIFLNANTGTIEANAAGAYGPGLVNTYTSGLTTNTGFTWPAVAATDSNTSPHVAGVLLYDNITDFITFDSPFRGWVTDGVLPAAAADRWCQTGETCAIRDIRPLSTDTLILGYYGEFVASAACPASVDASSANNVITDLQSAPNTFLRSAYEIIGDWTGDEDGLCESSERCIFAPNAGYYQGEGDYASNGTCTFTGGNGVTAVTLYGYPDNGL